MRRVIGILMAAASVTGCASTYPQASGAAAAGISSPNIHSIPTPPAYIECLRKEAPERDSEYQLGLACRNILDDYANSIGFGPASFNHTFVVYNLDARTKQMREQLVAEAGPRRATERKARDDAEKAKITASVQAWGSCSVNAVVENDKPDLPILDAVRIAKLACGHLWTGTPGYDDGLYYRIVKAVREGQRSSDEIVAPMARQTPREFRF